MVDGRAGDEARCYRRLHRPAGDREKEEPITRCSQATGARPRCAGDGAAGMSAMAKRDKFKQFAAAHALRGDAVDVRTKPTDRGLLVSVSCSCGASTVDTLTRRECA